MARGVWISRPVRHDGGIDQLSFWRIDSGHTNENTQVKDTDRGKLEIKRIHSSSLSGSYQSKVCKLSYPTNTSPECFYYFHET